MTDFSLDLDWNYRVVEHGYGYAIHEVFYNEEGTPIAYAYNPKVFVEGHTDTMLKELFSKFQVKLSKVQEAIINVEFLKAAEKKAKKKTKKVVTPSEDIPDITA